MSSRSLFAPPPTPPLAAPEASPPAPAPQAISVPAKPRIERNPVLRTGSAESPYTVAGLSEQVREILQDGFPRSLWLEGEVSQATERNGHWYLTFREEKSVLEAVAWASDARHFRFEPRQGDRVRTLGRLRAYAGRSRYQLQIRQLERAGIGLLLQELVEREKRLEAEGLFDDALKRRVPYLPLRIGLLTSVGSDAWADFMKAARTRFPGVLIREHDTPVQGERAPAALAAGIHTLGRERLDVIVVARGGGSVEDLLPFSDEAVVRAAAACPVPLVSAIGHEQDRPLLDRAADRRVSTPSAAARELLPERSELLREIAEHRRESGFSARQRITAARQRRNAFSTHRVMAALPAWILGETRNRALDRTGAQHCAHGALRRRGERLGRILLRIEKNHPQRWLADQRTQLGTISGRLAGLSPCRGPEARLAALRPRIAAEPLRHSVGSLSAAVEADRAGFRRAAAGRIERCCSTVRALRGQLDALDPRAVLQRGYSLVLDSGGRAVLSPAQVSIGDRLRLLLGEGELGATVESIRRESTTDGAGAPPREPEEEHP